MTLRWSISLTAWFIRLWIATSLILTGFAAREPLLGCVLGLGWFFGCGPLLRGLILPALFPATTCPGCRRVVPLVGRWKCGDHFTDSTDRHILSFFCGHGHRLEGFDCPRCRATIVVQKGDRQLYRHGSAVRLRVLARVSANGNAGLLLGHDQRRAPVLLPPQRLAWHVAITGGTGRGKSTLLLNLVRQLALRGTGFTVLDPGGDLARAVVQQIPPAREADTVYVDIAETAHPFPLNILSARDASEASVLAEELLGVFHRLHGTSWGPLLAHQLRLALRSVMSVGGTLRDVYELFSSAEARAQLLTRLTDRDLRGFWLREFPQIPPARHTAVTNKLAPVVLHPTLAPVLCARSCALDTDRLIAEQGTLVVNLASGSPGDDVTTLLGTFLVQKVLAAVFRQAAVPPEARVPHVLIVDEFQRFMHKAAGFDQILTESRKYRLSLVIANQYAEQLTDGVRAALFGNVGCLVAFRVGHRDARILTPEFTGAIPEDLMELERGQCLVRLGTDWTGIRTLPPPAPPLDDPTARILAATRQWLSDGDPQHDGNGAATFQALESDESEFVR